MTREAEPLRLLSVDIPPDDVEWIVDPRLKDYATAIEREYIDTINETRGYRAAARKLGRDHSALIKGIGRVRKRAHVQGYDPGHDMTHPTRAPSVVKGVSTYYNREGNPTQQWVKTRLTDQAYLESMKEAIDAFLEAVPQIPVAAPPVAAQLERDIIPWINIGDAHIGMLAHEAEVGANFDLKIAERELCAAIAILIDELPPSERLVIYDCGDGTHYETFKAETEASGHVLDFDSRYPRMVRVYSRVMRFIIDRALTKAQTVDVIINQGNHSRSNDVWMAEVLRVAYGATGRVNVLDNDSVFVAYRMGKTLVLAHHGDKCKPEKLASVLASDYARDWGETSFRFVWMGHVHHRFVAREFGGCEVEAWNTLAGKDRWAHDGGWRSRQLITRVNLSRTYGEVGRRRLPIEEIRDRIMAAHKDASAIYLPMEKRAFAV